MGLFLSCPTSAPLPIPSSAPASPPHPHPHPRQHPHSHPSSSASAPHRIASGVRAKPRHTAPAARRRALRARLHAAAAAAQQKQSQEQSPSDRTSTFVHPLIGKTIHIRWPATSVWVDCEVVQYDCERGPLPMHLVRYADGFSEWKSLQHFTVVEDEPGPLSMPLVPLSASLSTSSSSTIILTNPSP